MNADLRLYDHLLRFQLFHGLSRGELLQMAGNTKFGFLKEPPGRVVAADGQPCGQLLFLVSGSLQLQTRSADGGYTLVEQLVAPWAVQPEALFGVNPRYTGTWTTTGNCHFITLSKEEVMRLAEDFLVIRLNLLGLMATMVQRRQQRLWRRAPESLRERFVRFLTDRATYPAGPKELRMLMTRLAQELGESRLDTSRMLNALQAEGLLSLHRARIVVPSLERLLQ